MGLIDSVRAWLTGGVSIGSASAPRGDTRHIASSPTSNAEITRSGAHLLLLGRFLHGAEAINSNDGRWAKVLGESETMAVARLQAEGLLLEAPLEAAIQLAYQSKELKALAHERGLRVSGTKPELTQRLIAADATEARQLLGARRFLICSGRGKSLADAFGAQQYAARAEAERQTLEFLNEKRLREATKVVASFEAKQVFGRGLGIDWTASDDPTGSVEELESIFSGTPQILAGVGPEKLDTLRIGAGMDLLWGTNSASRWLPEGFESGSRFDLDVSARMLVFYAFHQRNLASYSSLGSLLKRVSVAAVHDNRTCTSCRKIQGHAFALRHLPELPYEKCTSEMGCRCTTKPLFE